MFHFISEELFRWLTVHPLAKEEAITNWLQHMLAKSSGKIYFDHFTRQTDALADSYMEWWVLTTEKDSLCAYRFLVQAKRLPVDASVLISDAWIANQIDSLIEAAKIRSAMPLYLYYSCLKPVSRVQARNFPYINSKLTLLCDNCVNGAYLALAKSVRGKVINRDSRDNLEMDLLNCSLGFSMCDLIFDKNHTLHGHKNSSVKLQQSSDEAEPVKILSAINRFYISSEAHGDSEEQQGIRHSGSSIPEYLYRIINNRNNSMNERLAEMANKFELPLSIVVFDCSEPQKNATHGED